MYHDRGYEEDVMRRGEKMRHGEDDRRHRSGASIDRHHRDREREERRDRDKYREDKDRVKPRDPEKDRYTDRRREDTRERGNHRNEYERELRKDRESQRRVDIDGGRRESHEKDRRYDRVEKDNRDKERERYKEKMSEREKVKEKDRRRAEREREQRSDRDRRKEDERDRTRDFTRQKSDDRLLEKDRERRERNKSMDPLKEREHHRDGKERHRDRREHSGYREGRDHRRSKEEEERRQKEQDRLGGGEMRDQHHRDNKSSDNRNHGDRDRVREKETEERDRHREKRQKDELERIRKDSQRASSSRNPKDSRDNREGENEKEAEKPSPENDEEVDYEEDFEDYEEDFEDDDDDDEDHDSGEEEKEDDKEDTDPKEEEHLSPQKREEVRAIQRAMNEENERVGSSQSLSRTEESPRSPRTPRTPRSGLDNQPPRAPKSRGVIDFVSAKRREVSKKVSIRQKKRSNELLRLIDLDFSITFSLLDLPPVNEYDMYIKSFGTTNTKQAYVQCNEDNTDREVQTEETDCSDKWTQHPAETSTACGGSDQSQDTLVDPSLRTNFDSRRLVSFLRSATQVMSVLLEEERAERHPMTRLKAQADALSFSDGCLQLNTRLPFLHGRQVSHLHFSDGQRQTLLSAHTPSCALSAVRLDSQSIVCVWNIWEPSRPQKILVYESEITCCCFSPGKAMLVFAGTCVGSVVLWDLREASSSHYSLTIGESDWTLRYPTFSTDAVLSVPGHLTTVQSVEPVTAPVSEGFRHELPLLANQEESLGLSFQLASLDEKGVLNLWVVVELPKYSDAGSQTDLGLRPGGKVKLLHSSTLQTCDSRSSGHDVTLDGPLQAQLLKFLPADSSHYFIGTNMGVVNHGTRHGLKAPPKFYMPQVAGFRPVQVSCLDFCPNGQPHFLVGCDDGSVRLHSLQCEQPLLEWSGSTAGVAIVVVQWALTRPAVFCVLDSASCLHLWDLLEDEKAPVLTEKIDADRVATMAMFGDPAKQNTYSGVALAKHSGRIEIHYFRKRFTVASSADSEKLDSLVLDAF
ncbi:cytoplasmic dynein 2 intermediate chain 1 isoform X2 [Engraulis encrasicolus]|uniref:cytoplasmic dynein 2 intermediate chain 1 isoform X2 n=1 Tax=Engraulis encrasicolus TaxID=184585 RepID=UPI002FCF45EB